eukprot:1005570-Pelagomonas_calceolata.AAC.1
MPQTSLTCLQVGAQLAWNLNLHGTSKLMLIAFFRGMQEHAGLFRGIQGHAWSSLPILNSNYSCTGAPWPLVRRIFPASAWWLHAFLHAAAQVGWLIHLLASLCVPFLFDEQLPACSGVAKGHFVHALTVTPQHVCRAACRTCALACGQGSTTVYLNDTYYQLAQRHPEVPRITERQVQVCTRQPGVQWECYKQCCHAHICGRYLQGIQTTDASKKYKKVVIHAEGLILQRGTLLTKRPAGIGSFYFCLLFRRAAGGPLA